jgi:dTDP-4-amino-4,6-dideoxygalactose transaminase
MIDCSNPLAQFKAHQQEIEDALLRVARGGWYILGSEVQAFEREFAAYCGTAHAVGVADGTDAVHLALRAAGIGPGDEVITVSNTAVATIVGIEMAGAVPVLVDVDPNTLTIDLSKAAAAIGPHTRAILPVHLFGQPADLSGLRQLADENKILLIEDCAQAHGARWNGSRAGSFGDLSCFSFYPTKNLGALGDGGAVVTNSENFATALRELRQYGWGQRYLSTRRGMNSRLDEIQAAVLRVKLKYLDEDLDRRRGLASIYLEALQGAPVQPLAVRGEAEHAYHLFVIRSSRRDALRAHLAERGIATLIQYPTPVHLQPAYLGEIKLGSPLPVTEQAAGEILSLPMYPELPASDVLQVCRTIQEYV